MMPFKIGYGVVLASYTAAISHTYATQQYHINCIHRPFQIVIAHSDSTRGGIGHTPSSLRTENLVFISLQARQKLRC
jgi:hypothetical protein